RKNIKPPIKNNNITHHSISNSTSQTPQLFIFMAGY
ncbi:hypothetical protein D1BOALGB6SA_1364, partial [Olavius sp. associated proteobacterium Delta 1]